LDGTLNTISCALRQGQPKYQLGTDGPRNELKTESSERKLRLDPRALQILRAHKRGRWRSA
jgi:hypothetical protein